MSASSYQPKLSALVSTHWLEVPVPFYWYSLLVLECGVLLAIVLEHAILDWKAMPALSLTGCVLAMAWHTVLSIAETTHMHVQDPHDASRWIWNFRSDEYTKYMFWGAFTLILLLLAIVVQADVMHNTLEGGTTKHTIWQMVLLGVLTLSLAIRLGWVMMVRIHTHVPVYTSHSATTPLYTRAGSRKSQYPDVSKTILFP